LRAQHIARLIAEYFGPNTIEVEKNIVTIVDPENDRFMITVAPTFRNTDFFQKLPNPED